MRRFIRFICRSIWNYCFGDFIYFSYNEKREKHIDIASPDKEAQMKQWDRISQVLYKIRHEESYPYSEARSAIIEYLIGKLPIPLKKELYEMPWDYKTGYREGCNQALTEIKEILKKELE